MALTSMTGFAEIRGQAEGLSWIWEIRSVNSKGLDLRLRLPDSFDALDPVIRAKVRSAINRGAVTVGLKVSRTGTGGATRLNPDGLTAAIGNLLQAEAAAMQAGLDLGPTNAADILAQRGVLEAAEAEDDAAWLELTGGDIDDLFSAFAKMRRAEGLALADVLSRQFDRIAELLDQASNTLEARAARAGEVLRQRIAELLGSGTVMEPDRLAQELALMAVKSDVSEEIDRLRIHVAAARAMVANGGPVGRKLDFLMQEFNREANTLCAKSASTELTAIGLDLKVTIDQAREQVQNVE